MKSKLDAFCGNINTEKQKRQIPHNVLNSLLDSFFTTACGALPLIIFIICKYTHATIYTSYNNQKPIDSLFFDVSSVFCLLISFNILLIQEHIGNKHSSSIMQKFFLYSSIVALLINISMFIITQLATTNITPESSSLIIWTILNYFHMIASGIILACVKVENE